MICLSMKATVYSSPLLMFIIMINREEDGATMSGHVYTGRRLDVGHLTTWRKSFSLQEY